jgi:hypothetical protein
MAHRTLDDLAYQNDHAQPVHPLRHLIQNNFFLGDLVNTEGGLWIVLMDALLFIPLMMAAFFYPWQSLIVGAVALVVSFIGYEGWVLWERRHPHA